jgi:putative transposase
MTNDKIALRELLEKGSDASFLREMNGFVGQRLRELETKGLCSAGHGERGADRRTSATATATATGDPCGHRRVTHPEAAQWFVFPRLPGTRRTAEPFVKLRSADGGNPGSLHPGYLDTLGG